MINVKYSIISSPQTLNNRYTVKCFNSSNAMHVFLSKQYDNKWSVTEYPFKKSGTYFSQYCSKNGQRYINTKELIC